MNAATHASALEYVLTHSNLRVTNAGRLPMSGVATHTQLVMTGMDSFE